MATITENWHVYEVYCYEYEAYTMNILALTEDEAIDIFKQSLKEDGLDMDMELHFRTTSICCDVYKRENY